MQQVNQEVKIKNLMQVLDSTKEKIKLLEIKNIQKKNDIINLLKNHKEDLFVLELENYNLKNKIFSKPDDDDKKNKNSVFPICFKINNNSNEKIKQLKEENLNL
jgi:hypothetical protein